MVFALRAFARFVRTPASLALALALATGAVAARWGSTAAGGADSYGYLSQADLWAQGHVRVHEPLVDEAPWPSADWTLSPLGYRPAFERNGDIVPVYPPGLPLTMTAFQMVGGSRAKLLVVPLLAALAVWLTYQLGTRLAGSLAGVVAAVWLATSPTLLFSAMSPMSDVPATTWWLLAIVLITSRTRTASVLAGLAAGVALMTRPNLLPIAGVLIAWAGWDAVRERSIAGPAAQRAALFVAGLMPGCVAIGLIFNSLHGSPFQSGYPPLRSLYAWDHARTNAPNYARWVLETLTPLILVALASPWVMARARATDSASRSRAVSFSWMALGFFTVLFVTYAFYLRFEAWWFVRFFLPAYPLLVVSSAAVLAAGLARWRTSLRVVTAIALCGALAAWGVTTSARRDVFSFGAGERKYPLIGRFVATRLPERAIVLSMQHSGSLRYYAGRLTLRYDLLEPEWLDRTLEALQRRQRTPYLLLEEWEEAPFRARFAAHSPIGRLDWPPMAELRAPGFTFIRIYAPRDRERYVRGEPVLTERIR